mmetsp:Transcript_4958/g.9464  ORF Transcript_4958/g.9464 Transcript_4958/m.9464 type:complete len:147 (+) Transcript_4958:310-750(+)
MGLVPFTVAVLLVLLTSLPRPASPLSHPSTSSREYNLSSEYSDSDYHPRSCGVACPEGGCKYTSCGLGSSPPSGCEGGLCEFVRCADSSCHGGACVFVGSEGSSCHGGGCHHVHPEDTLTDGYCDGGGCRLNGILMPRTLAGALSV